jgi:hypothetical protein
MRRIAILGALAAVGVLVVWARGAKLHERLMAHCEGMFERMPDTFPPKQMMSGIEEIRIKTARILELLETNQETGKALPETESVEEAHDAA